jgi:hypothetical protein
MSSKNAKGSSNSTEETQIFLLQNQVNDLAKIVRELQAEVKNMQVVIDTLPKKKSKKETSDGEPAPKRVNAMNFFIAEYKESHPKADRNAAMAEWKDLSAAEKETYKTKATAAANDTPAPKKPKSSKVAKSDNEASASASGKKSKSGKKVVEPDSDSADSAPAAKASSKKSKSSSKKPADESNDGSDEPEKTTKKPKAAKGAKKPAASDNDDDDEEAPAPKAKASKPAAKKAADSDDEEAKTTTKRKVGAKPKDVKAMTLSESDE